MPKTVDKKRPKNPFQDPNFGPADDKNAILSLKDLHSLVESMEGVGLQNISTKRP